ncbi:F-actin-capping protein subunit alpha-1 [Wickerhamomyces ciferrii]|uniref:F-actin-capping protein subunit alpha n=1 Tax=Wickerhamomyces ciferrii (strain ATCC 14091 / BCRC 22168 / CBS 111 / JCM 3599 / NBRC 0793 / NRRL Y-1031 F-60-10) TaxID=1206466 RepID=K0KRP2_WICCF|nr:F-actin-capping protein subunit alpha-1 [Wickerhamomyces ciferrii]CCH44013.1 F-actin-capping protein subunit alpha-1 [Wickerhamomyces ciferrii]
MSSLEQIIKDILKDTPVGEGIDLRLIVDKNIDVELTKGLELYNLEKGISINVDGQNSIISKINQINDSFINEQIGLKFKVDHLNSKAYDIETIDKTPNKWDKELIDYLNEQYENGEYLIYNDKLILKGDKSSPGNYWTGSWRSEYDLSNGKGEINIDVHYYEDGNVRLQSKKTSIEIDPKNLVKSIKKIEDDLQISLNKEFLKLNELIFKQLRRQLPITRSKMNWGKAIGNYKLGKNINQ